MQQTLAAFINAGCRFRKRAPLTAGDDGLQTRRCTFDYSHVVAPRRLPQFSVAHGSMVKNSVFAGSPEMSRSRSRRVVRDLPLTGFFLRRLSACAHVRFAAHNGLASATAICPKCANKRHHPPIRSPRRRCRAVRPELDIWKTPTGDQIIWPIRWQIFVCYMPWL
jgi:hypothetical protein